jgi:hypothetical protein
MAGSAAARQVAKPARPPVVQKGPVVSRIGDVRVSQYDRLRAKADGSGVTITGPKTIVEIPEAKDRSLLRFHADTIVSRKEGRDLLGQIDLSGSVRYTLTQQIERGGQRVVEGTSGRASYRRATRHVTLSEGVAATLTDPARLNGPGQLKADSVVIDIGASPYRYTIEGDSAHNDIRFMPRQSESGKANAPGKLHTGEVHIYGYDSGEFQIGQAAVFNGANTTADMDNPKEKTHTHFRAQTISAAFTAEHAALSRAEATGSVHYEVARPASDGSMQTLQGTSAHAVYDAQDSTIVLQGTVAATLTDPSTLLKPASLRADRVAVILDAKGQATLYKMTGAPDQTHLRFTPRPRIEATVAGAAGNKTAVTPRIEATPPAAGSTTPARVFPIGDIEVAQFDLGSFEPGKTLQFQGAQTVFGTADRSSRTHTQFQAKTVVATFADNRSIGRIEATGDVHFHVEQPALTASLPGSSLESVTGTATRATFVNTAQTREVTAYGPLLAVVRSPASLEGPGKIQGEADATLHLNLAARPYEFDIESPQQTAQVQFQPLSQAQNAAPAPPKK